MKSMRKKQFSARAYFFSLFFHPRKFFTEFLGSKSPVPRGIFFTLFLIFSLSLGIDQIDSLFVSSELQNDLQSISALNYWPLYLIFALVIGLVKGLIVYWISGTWYFLRLRFSGAIVSSQLGRHMYLTSSVVWDLVFVLTTLISITYHPLPYMPESIGTWVDFIVYVLLVFLYFYSVIVSYIGVRTITKARPWPARFWFLVLPIIFYLCIVFSGILLNIYSAMTV